MTSKIQELLNGTGTNLSDLLKPNSQGNLENVKSINLTDIMPDPDQVRRSENVGFSEEMDEEITNLSDLIASIKAIGVRQPIIVRNNPDKDSSCKYMIVSGERRYRASLKAGLEKIPAIVRDYDNEYDVKYDQITENIQRVDLTNFDIAFFIQTLKDNYLKENNKKLSNNQIAKLLGKSPKWVTEVSVFAECPTELLPYFKDGTVAQSLRLGYELINAWNREPEIVSAWFNDMRQTSGHIDRTMTASLSSYIATKKGLISEKKDPEFRIPEVEDEEDLPTKEADQEESSEEQENSDSEPLSDEYPDKEDKEKSAVPKMVPASQERSDHTAGLGKPDFTDADTRVSHDMSDRIREDESSSEELYDEDNGKTSAPQRVEVNQQSSSLGFSKIYCTYADPDDEKEDAEGYILDLTVICSDKKLGHIISLDKSVEMDVPLSLLNLLEIKE